MVQKQAVGLYALSLFPLTWALMFPTSSSTPAAHDSLRPDLPEATPWVDNGVKGLHRRDSSNDSSTGSATGSAVYPATTTFTEWASASVCGFVDGILDYSSEVACFGYTQCVFHTADVNYPAMVGCCNNAYSEECVFETTCYDSEQVAATPTLTDSAGVFAIFCTKPTAPSCVEWTYPELSITDFGCSSIKTTQTLYLTAHPYSNNVPDSRSLSYVNGIPTVASIYGSVVNDNFISDYINSVAAPTTGSVTRNGPASSSTVSSGATGATSDAQGSSAASGSGSAAHHSSNTAVIAGGVVGGVVGLAGIGAAIFMFFLMRKKKQNQQPAYEPAPTGGSALASPPHPPSSPPSGPPSAPPMSDLPSPSEVSGASFHNYAAVDAYQADQKFQNAPVPHEMAPLPHEMDARGYAAELPVPSHDARPLSYAETPVHYTAGHRYGN